MKRQSIYYLFICVLTMGFASCVSEQFTPDTLPAGMKALTLTIQTADDSAENQSMGVRAGKTALGEDKLNENKIDHFEVFVFNADGSFNWRVEPEYITRTEPENNTFSLSILVKEAEASNYEGKAFQICVVANHTKTLLADLVKPSLEELRQIVETTNLNTGEAQPMFLMDGLVDTKTIQWGSNPTFTVAEPLNLRRAAAKIRLRIPSIAIKVKGIDYTLEGSPSIKLVNYTNKTTLLQGGTPYEVQSDEWLTAGYQNMIEATLPGELKEWVTSIPFYAYENNWKDDSEKETYLMVMLNLKSGTHPSKEYYYLIPVNYRQAVAGVDEQELYQLKRNHLYDITSNIDILGSEDEAEPIEVKSNIAIQPWIASDIIDGSIQNIHYLMVKETAPQMFNVTTREVDYVSDLPIIVKINKAYFEWYDHEAKLIKVVWEGDDGKTKTTYTEGEEPKVETVDVPYGGATVSHDPATKKLTITHAIPTNFVPFHIDFTVTQVLPASESSKTPLFQNVLATQFPGKYITGRKSIGPGGGINEPEGGGYADFRYHSPLGVFYNPATPKKNTNTVLSQITTLTNDNQELIGDPTDSEGKTKKEEAPNKLISPQFIIASQYGLVLTTPQYTKKEIRTPWVEILTTPGIGPFEKKPSVAPYYYRTSTEPMKQAFVVDYQSAEERCFNYFEDEYGTDGEYVEQYISGAKVEIVKGKEGEDVYVYVYEYGSRMVKKTFKYNGRWRMPTKAEVELIDRLQDNKESAVKFLLQGSEYLSAQTGLVYNFADNVWVNRGMGEAQEGSVRCVFDTYKLENHP